MAGMCIVGILFAVCFNDFGVSSLKMAIASKHVGAK